MGKYPTCFGSNPSYQDQAEADCETCNYHDKCCQQSGINAIDVANKCLGSQNWEEEFEDEIKLFCGMDGIELKNKSICEFFEKYFGKLATAEGSNNIGVKIKARKGKIVIERID